MPTITDANGHSRSYATLEVNGTHLILDGWLAIDGPLSAYTVAGADYPMMEAFTFYRAFTVQERIAIKASTDPIVQEFWDEYQRAERLGAQIDPNRASVTGSLGYLAGETLGGHTISTPILASVERITQIRAGIAQ